MLVVALGADCGTGAGCALGAGCGPWCWLWPLVLVVALVRVVAPVLVAAPVLVVAPLLPGPLQEVALAGSSLLCLLAFRPSSCCLVKVLVLLPSSL